MHRPVVLNQSDFVPVGNLAMSRDIIGCHNREWVGALISSKLKPGILLNILPCTGQFLTTKGYPNVTSAKAEKPWHRLYAVSKGLLPLLLPRSLFFLTF